jgi:RND family efflux transporter MFP subunit
MNAGMSIRNSAGELSVQSIRKEPAGHPALLESQKPKTKNRSSATKAMQTALLLIFGSVLLAACGRPPASEKVSEKSPDPARVTIWAAVSKSHPATEEVLGTVRSRQQAVVESKVSGRVVEYTASPGSRVKAGDLLARLDVQEISAKVDQAQALMDQAGREYERQRLLMASKSTTQQEYDSADSRVKVATAALAEAKTMLGYARVTAPFDGVVTRKLADVGDLAMPGKPLLEMESPAALRFEADLPEAIWEHVKLGDRLTVRHSRTVEGVVSEISPVADPVSRTFRIKLDIPEGDGVRTGQFGRVSVPVAEVRLLLVPKASVIKRGQMEVVFVVREGRASLRLVRSGKVLGDQLEVLSGIEEGDQVIVGDIARLKDGQPVIIQP